MSDQTHTPGPWRVGRSGAVVADVAVQARAMDQKDVEYYGGQLIAESFGSEADARLVAAAPALLTACLALMEDVRAGGADLTVSLATAERAVDQAINGDGLTPYERGRRDVRRELTAAVRRFNDDESQGMGNLIDVIEPWLDPDEGGAQ